MQNSDNMALQKSSSVRQLSSVVEQRFCKSPRLVPLAPIPLNKPFVLAAGTLCHGQGVRMETFFRAFEAESFYSRRLKPASKQYRKDNLLYLKRTWPSLENRDV